MPISWRTPLLGAVVGLVACAHRVVELNPAASNTECPVWDPVEPSVADAPLANHPRHHLELPEPVFADPERRTKIDATLPLLRSYLLQVANEDAVTGLAFGVVLDGELIFAEGFGLRDVDLGARMPPDGVFRIASLTKLFTATALLQLRDEGELALDDPASRHLPELSRLAHGTTDDPTITLRHLLTHTAGLPRDVDLRLPFSDAGASRSEVLESLDGVLLFEPGAREQYSNLGFVILGAVIDRVSDLSYEEHVAERVLKPLGMQDTAWDDKAYAPDRVALAYARGPNGLVPRPFSSRGARSASGGLFSTVPDMARFVILHLDAWPPRSAAEAGPLRRASLREGHVGETLPRLIARPMPSAEGWSPVVGATGHAWGVRVDCEHEHVLTHTGGLDGHVSTVLLLPRHGLGLILLASATSLEPAAVTYEALDILATNGLPARQHRPSDALLRSVERLLPLLAAFEDGEFERLFAWYLHDSIDRFREVTSKLSDRVGACTDYEVVEVSNPFAGRFLLKCDRGDIHLDMELPRNLPERIGYARMGIAGGPAPKSVEIMAKNSLRLLRRFDARIFRSTFAEAFDRRGLERYMGVVRSQLGSCRIANVEAHTDTSARYGLACEYGSATLELEVPAQAGKIGAYRIIPRRSSRPCSP